MSQKYPFIVRYTFILASLFLTIYGIIIAKDLLYPMAFGMLLSYLFLPLANFLEKHRFPRILANLITILVAVALLFFTFFFIYKLFASLMEDFPALRSKALSNIDALVGSIESKFGITDDKFEIALKETVSGIFDLSRQSFNTVLSATTNTLFAIGILPVYIFLFLYYRTKFAIFILKLVPKDKKFLTVKILKDISHIASSYMWGVSTVVFILCFVNSFGLYIIGMKYALVLGVISALCNFIPYFGTLIGAAVAFLFALLTGDNPLLAFRIIGLFAVIQFLENNILTPNIVGYNVKINPFFIIISLIVAGTVWGIAGMLVIIPVLAMLKIVITNIDSLQPFAFLLDNRGTKKHSLTFKKIKHRLFHKTDIDRLTGKGKKK